MKVRRSLREPILRFIALEAPQRVTRPYCTEYLTLPSVVFSTHSSPYRNRIVAIVDIPTATTSCVCCKMA